MDAKSNLSPTRDDVLWIMSHRLKSEFLSYVRLTGHNIGSGPFGTVEEVAIPGSICAARILHSNLQNPRLFPRALYFAMVRQYAEECDLLSSINHPNIVKFLGLYSIPNLRLPALVMERLHLNLQGLLISQRELERQLPLSMKVSILSDVARAIEYLHCEQSPPILHCDLSAANVVVSNEMEAKIIDLGFTRKLRSDVASTLSIEQGISAYMPPELNEKAALKAHQSIDIFSFGVLTLFVISQIPPDDLLPPTYIDKNLLMAHTELDRREKHMKKVEEQIRNCDQLHPLSQLIQQCLHNDPAQRPDIQEAMHILESARGDQESLSDFRQQLTQSPEWLQFSAIRECNPGSKEQVCVSVLAFNLGA